MLQLNIFYVICIFSMAEGADRPYIRSALARNLYSKMLMDESLRNMDLNEVSVQLGFILWSIWRDAAPRIIFVHLFYLSVQCSYTQ